ncbi:MAG: TonB-dependent receptor [Bacteroidota bacterium]
MKISALLLLTSIFALQANNGYSQRTKVSVDLEGVTIEKFIDVIESKTEYRFLYLLDDVDLNRKITIKAERERVSRILEKAFSGTNTGYSINDRQISLIKKNLETEEPKQVSTVNFQTVVTGTVNDEEGVPLPGANVIEKGTTNGTQTDFDGNFSLEVNDSNAVLVISYIGYLAQEVPVGDNVSFSINLVPDTAKLDEVVVIGYGTQVKSDLTGAVASISEEDFQNGSKTSVDQMLQGKVAGAQITQSSAQPGGGVSFRIRGNGSLNSSNEPLYVIDGVPISNVPPIQGNGANIPTNTAPNPLSTISPQDIKSIEILKDASATAIYGSRGANGVVIITTKSGSEGALAIDYSATSGFQTVANPIDLLSGADYVEQIGAILTAEGSSLLPGLSDASINTDWQDVIFETAFMQQHNISLSGGTANSKVYASANYTQQEGTVRGSGFERLGARLNWDVTKGKFSASANVSTSLVLDDIAPFGSTGNNVNLDAGVISTTLGLPNTIPLRDAEGNLTNPVDVTLDNPINIADGIDIRGRTSRTLVNLRGAYKLLDDLEISARVGTDVSNSRRDAFRSTQTLSGAAAGGVANVLTSKINNYTIEALLNYNKSWENHTLGALGGYTYQSFDVRSFDGTTQGFLDDQLGTDNLGAGNQAFNQLFSSREKSAIASFLSRVNYTYKNKLLLTASVRADGSSRFADGEKWGVFPSFSVGYRISEEPFFENVNFVNSLKVRFGWGQIGNQEIPTSASVNTFVAGSSAVFGDTPIVGLSPARIPNPNLTWETSEQLNFGLDFSLFGSRLSGSLDVYDKKTKDLLFAQPVPLQTGFGFQFVNLDNSEISNSGVELVLNGVIIKGDKFGWESSLNFTANSNEITSLGDNEAIITNRSLPPPNPVLSTTINRVGDAPFSYFGLQSEGIWQTGEDPSGSAQPDAIPGQPKWIDQNNDGVIDANDRTILGDPYADFIWGLNNTFTFGRLNLSVFIEGVEGVELFSTLLANTYLPFDNSRNRLAEPILNRWTPNNPTNEWPSFINAGAYGGDVVNSFTVQDASFIRLKTVSLSYDLNVDKLKFVRNLSVSLTGQNLGLITDYLGFDPDVAGSGNTRNDIDSYPNSRTFLLGLNVGF